MSLFYDFHIHSCLSPCAEEDMTPYNLVNLSALMGMEAIALTDHNSCRNCGAAMRAGAEAGITVIPGMELCTSEEVHVVCLFEELKAAEEFSDYVLSTMPPIKNRPEIFGTQLIMDETDKVLGTQELLLTAASGISISNAEKLVDSYGGVCYPAHIDRSSYSVISNLGMITEEMGFEVAEVSTSGDVDALIAKHPILAGMKILTSSDAHRLDALPPANLSLHTDNNVKSIIHHLKNR
ncbi:MAG: PHP domain-containing protein [Clostridia bacterium]|nr:PHP domain-containing protein [Clostridia bacterium]